MGLFSFLKKDVEAAPPKRASRRTSRPGARAAGGEYSEHAQLDPLLPEKQRARRRFVGALALVLAAVIILPMVLAPEPKPATDDIVIQIPAKDATLAPVHVKAAQQSLDNDEEEVGTSVADDAANASHAATNTSASSNAKASSSPALNTAASKPSAPAQIAAVPGVPTEVAASAKPSPTPPQPAQHAQPVKPPVAQTASAKPAPKPEAKRDMASTSADKAPAKGHYQIRIGAFASEERANAWLIKLKLVNVPSYMEKKKVDDRQLYLLRAGPFSDKSGAESAVKKIRDIGLTAQIVEG